MDSQLPETPTPAGRSVSSSFSGVHLNCDEDLQYALPDGIPVSSNSCAVTSASSSVKDGYSTPPYGYQGRTYTTPSGALNNPPTGSINGIGHTFVPLEAQVSKLKNDLETHYSIQCNHRLQKLLIQFPGGVPKEETENFKQREAVERTKFVVYKDNQLAKLVNDLTGGLGSHKDPFVSPATPTQFHRYQNKTHDNPTEHTFNVNNPFAVNHSIPPPPRSSRDRSANSNSVSGFSFSSLASMSSKPASGVPVGAHSAVNGSIKDDYDANFPALTETASDKTDTMKTTCTREQIIAAFTSTWNQIDAAKAETAQLRTQVSDLKQVLMLLIGSSDSTDLTSRVAALEAKFAPGNNAVLESDVALLANLSADVASLRIEVANTSSNAVSRRAFNAENELTKMTFNNKCALIEKYLGIDITTTGPKPHDVLEALHRRIWHLEELLAADDSNCKAGKQYHPLNYYMKTTLSKHNSVINYSATPGYTSPAFNDTSSMTGGTALLPESVQTSLKALALISSPEPAEPSLTPQEKTWAQLAQANMPKHHGRKVSMNVDQADVRHPTHISNLAGPNPGSANGIIPYYVNTHIPRGTSMPSLLPQGTLADMSPRNNFAYKSRARGSASRSSLGVTSPRGRKSAGGQHRSRTNSTSTTKATSKDSDKDSGKEVGKEKKGPSPTKTKDRAYQAWLNQRPGDFFGKKLTGLGQKE